VISGMAVSANQSSKPVSVILNATSGYKANNASEIGLNGTVGYININSRNTGSPATATLKFSMMDDANAGTALPFTSVTFVDLDANNMIDSVEYVKVKGFQKYTLSNTSLVKVTGPDMMGAYTFTGNSPGSGADNPMDPTVLTPQQLSKSVTLEFPAGTVSFEAELGCSAGNSVRYIGFVLRPSIICYNASGASVASTR